MPSELVTSQRQAVTQESPADRFLSGVEYECAGGKSMKHGSALLVLVLGLSMMMCGCVTRRYRHLTVRTSPPRAKICVTRYWEVRAAGLAWDLGSTELKADDEVCLGRSPVNAQFIAEEAGSGGGLFGGDVFQFRPSYGGHFSHGGHYSQIGAPAEKKVTRELLVRATLGKSQMSRRVYLDEKTEPITIWITLPDYVPPGPSAAPEPERSVPGPSAAPEPQRTVPEKPRRRPLVPK